MPSSPDSPQPAVNRTNRCFPSLLQLSHLTDSATHRAYSTLSVDSPSQRYPSTLDLSRTDGLTVPSLQPLALCCLANRSPPTKTDSRCHHYSPWPLAALQTAHLQLKGCYWVDSASLSPWHPTISPSLQVSTAHLQLLQGWVVLFLFQVASSSAALPQIHFKLSNSRYCFVLCFSDSN
ncbi:hypothetical protein SLEP1_g27019 [Rubroshorea leprosula]|uniref:Uncharacterized protein n=1 Tax=Rubroshorea leprosula TaxID=152421 RepID=A0AAV5JXR2_9ROSI|nr:hypothetical protein SLEP1_g27019 [Rubroshorea leprosula]